MRNFKFAYQVKKERKTGLQTVTIGKYWTERDSKGNQKWGHAAVSFKSHLRFTTVSAAEVFGREWVERSEQIGYISLSDEFYQ